ncbi:MAG: nucleotidyltransferase [Epsilonproteobacteria bacterium]|nr:nucleotidyltransferase [Campylobacterota bacterium]
MYLSSCSSSFLYRFVLDAPVIEANGINLTWNEIEKAGLIQFFEVGFELAWKVMKDYLVAEGYEVKSPRESIKQAFQHGLIDDGALWLEALEKRNLSAHTYDETILDELEKLIVHTYYPMMEKLQDVLAKKTC